MESPETSAEVQKPVEPELGAVSEITTPAPAHADVPATVAGIAPSVGARDAKSKIHAVPERSTDKRSVQRHANEQKARAGHRRSIRRSNTNG